MPASHSPARVAAPVGRHRAFRHGLTVFTAVLVLWALLPPGAALARESGEATIAVGAVWPQGTYAAFADAGGLGNFRIAGRSNDSVVGFWLGLSAVFFRSDSTPVGIEIGNTGYLGKRRTSEWATAIHLGPQLGSGSHRAMFRPHVSVAPGFYLFFQDESIRLVDGDENITQHSIVRGRGGWRGFAGADFFFARKWGLALDFVYDQAFNVVGGRSARYQGIAIGVVLPMEDDGKGGVR